MVQPKEPFHVRVQQSAFAGAVVFAVLGAVFGSRFVTLEVLCVGVLLWMEL